MPGSAPPPDWLRAHSIHGREAALGAVAAMLDAESGGAALALVGEAGMGKTRLARWAAAAASERGRTVLEGQTVLGLVEPLGAMCDAVRAARRSGLEPLASDRIAAGFPSLILPELGAGPLDAENLGATFDASTRYLTALAGRRGLLLILEDLHWAEPTSLRLVGFLARALGTARVAMLVTLRPDDLAAAPALEEMRRQLRRTSLSEEVVLAPLGEPEAGRMLTEILGRRPGVGVERELVRLSGGNPFALEELTRAAVESGWLAEADVKGPGAPLLLPFTLTDSIRARIARLDPPQRELMAWAAVLGDRFDARLLAAVAGLDDEATLSALEGCIGAGLLSEDRADASGHGFTFRHALVREALTQEGLTARWRVRHARVLEVARRSPATDFPSRPRSSPGTHSRPATGRGRSR